VSSEYDAFSRTAAALSATYREHAALLDATPAQFRNYMLDVCGSDHCALVELLLSVGPQLRPRLSAAGTTATWQVRRAPMVHQIVATRYLQPDVARWLVDAWGAALDVAPQQIVRPTMASVSDPLLGATDFPRAVAGARRQTPSAPHTKSVVPVSPTLTAGPQLPSWAGGPSRPRVGARGPVGLPGKGTHGPGGPRLRSTGPALNATMVAQARRVERAWLAVMACTLLGVFVAAAVGIANRKAAAVTEASVLPAVEPLSAAATISRNATGSLHSLPKWAADSVVKADTAAAVQLIASAADGPHLIAAGLGGRYRVIQRVRSVSGSRNCDQVASALAKGRTTVEVVSHTPGTFFFAIASRNVAGTLMPDAEFEAGPQSGTTDGVNWRFRMQGHFTPGGFVGESQTSTNAIIRWGRSQSCLTVTDLVGERLPP